MSAAEQNPEQNCSMDMKTKAAVARCCHWPGLLVFAALVGLAIVGPQAQGATIWDGPTTTFIKPNFADWTQPANQDRMTSGVWLTRNSTLGLFNAATETSYTHHSSPADTQWAYGTLANYASLTYRDWEDWFGGRAGGGPPSTVGKPAVLHLVAEDIYLSIEFTSWGGSSGGFSYQRSTPSVPEPSTALILLAGLGALGCLKWIRAGLKLHTPSSRIPRSIKLQTS